MRFQATRRVVFVVEINAEIRMAEMLQDRSRQIGIARGGLGINIDGSAAPGP
jgi:hypothetical protein